MKTSTSYGYESNKIQNLSYTVAGTHKIEDGMLASKTKGTFAHRDFSAEYEEDGKYEGLQYGAFIELKPYTF